MVLGAVIGGFDVANIVVASLSGREVSAPQQGGAAAMAVAWAVIPYVFVRSIEKMIGPEERELKKLNETLAKLLALQTSAPLPPIQPQGERMQSRSIYADDAQPLLTDQPKVK